MNSHKKHSQKSASSRVMGIAIPMIFSNLTIPLLGLVDTAVIGHLEHAYYLAAVGVAVVIFNSIYYAFGFLRMGTTGLSAQALGRKDYQGLLNILWRGLFTALFIAAFIVIFQVPILKAALWLASSSHLVSHYVARYYHYRIWGAPFALMNYVMAGWFIGLHKPKHALAMMTVTNVVAMLLDVVFVYGYMMNVAGVALAAVFGQLSGFLVSVYLALSILKKQDVRFDAPAIFQWEKIKEMFHLNKDIFIRTLALIFGFAFFTRQSLQLGVLILAANTVLFNFQEIMAYALDGFANAAEALVGEAIGAHDESLLKRMLKATAAWSFWVALGFSIVFLLFGVPMIHIMTGISTVRLEAYRYLPFAIALPVFSVWAYWLDGVFVGAMASKAMRNTMLIAAFAFVLSNQLLHFAGNTGLWLSFGIFLVTRAIAMLPFLPRIIARARTF